MGKACVYDSEWPAVPDGHVTVIRVDPKQVNPYYLADYLRAGSGAIQIERRYIGSTGMMELQPEEVDQILVDLLSGPEEQATVSQTLREAEKEYRRTLEGAATHLEAVRTTFGRHKLPEIKKTA